METLQIPWGEQCLRGSVPIPQAAGSALHDVDVGHIAWVLEKSGYSSCFM